MFLIFLLTAFTIAAAEYELPSDFLRCEQRDTKINDCLKKAVPDALRRMKDGIPLLSVPPLEPLLVSGMNIESGAGPVVITQIYKAIKIHGLTDSILTTYKADLKHFRLRTDSITPKMEFIADYVMKGRILVLPIHGKGIANITMANLVVKHDLIGEPVVKDGETYMHIKDYRVKFIPGKVYLHFSNLFNGDKRLGDQMNIFLNENADLVFNELKESYEKSLSSVFQDVTNKIFDKVPMKKIFPEE
ncbi:protein takeout-like [Maniola hyperantus]|uniref:protein takeout-like n=1 Tax=Aphantopus hyperantus TaxID=2795564 RepID=UPI0015681119|nr:protein takeout-like [Maniola hyperantus]